MATREQDIWAGAVARCYISNPGGGYDPAPLPELDTLVSCMPAVGDFIMDAPPRSRVERVFRVIERHFKPTRYQVALIVEEVDPPAVTPFI